MGKWLEEEARRDKEVVKVSTHLATRHLVIIIKFVVVVVESVKETMDVWTHLAIRQNLTKYTRKQMKCSQNWKRPNQPKSENGKQTAKDLWSKVELDKREEKRFRCQISDDHFWAKVEPCRCKWGEVSWQSGTLASGGRSLKSGWKIVRSEVWLWKRSWSEVEEIWFHWLYNRPPGMFPDRKPLSLQPNVPILSLGWTWAWNPAAKGRSISPSRYFLSPSPSGKLQEHNIFPQFTLGSTLRIWTAQCQFSL